jgi:hypothetical protein
MRRWLWVAVLVAGCGGSGRSTGGVGGGGDEGTPDGGTVGQPDLAKPRTDCKYPSGPYGTDVGEIVAPTLAWEGYAAGASTVSTTAIADLHDCDGSRNVSAILISQAAQWCGVCKREAGTLEDEIVSRWAPKKVKTLVLVIETSSGAPATTTTARQWRDAYGLHHAAVLSDPDFTFGHPGTNSLPVHAIIDPRTMKVVDKPEGSESVDSVVESLAQKNQ